MIKEIIETKNEFFSFFPQLSEVEFSRYLHWTLKPYFELENGKEILLLILDLLHVDMEEHNKDNSKTFLIPRGGKFKSNFCEKNGFDHKIHRKYDLTISDYINPHNTYDLIFMSHYRLIFTSLNFESYRNFIAINYDFFKNYLRYEKKEITLKELKQIKKV